jgi:hypothetical protein
VYPRPSTKPLHIAAMFVGFEKSKKKRFVPVERRDQKFMK